VTTPREVSAARAAAAAASVRGCFGRRLLGLPGTHLPHVAAPGGTRLGPWQYWWLAHYVDCLVDEAEREQRGGRSGPAEDAVTLAHRTLRGIRIRNGLRLRNRYFDDMGWLLVAVQRLQGAASPAGRRSLAAAETQLSRALRAGASEELGGGLYWNDRRDLKNVAATGPVALYCARAGDRAKARRLVDWVYDRLLDPQSGLLLDGLRRGADGQWHVVREVYTYNQGVVLGALVELGDPASLARATDLVDAIDTQLAAPGEARLLTTHGGHDGGLFTGIAARYLALAGRSPALPHRARVRAAALVRDSAAALWEGRAERPSTARGPWYVFSPDPSVPAHPCSTARRIELSTQLQAWMILEAAAALDALGDRPARPDPNEVPG
jgi:predicted alpha-1,6-mannanase (GH76 family)